MNKKVIRNKKYQKIDNTTSTTNKNTVNEEEIRKLVKNLTNAFVDDFNKEQNEKFSAFFPNKSLNNKSKKFSNRQMSDLFLEEITKLYEI